MPLLRKMGPILVLSAAAVLAGCASQTEFDAAGGRIGQLEKSVADLQKRVDALAAGDRQAAERAAQEAQDAKLAAEQAKRSADAAAASSAKTEAMFRKSLRK